MRQCEVMEYIITLFILPDKCINRPFRIESIVGFKMTSALQKFTSLGLNVESLRASDGKRM